MTKLEIIRWTNTPEGKPYSWLVNMICCQYNKKAKKLKGLYNLAQQDRVGHGNDISTVRIDGRIVHVNTLEDFA